MYSEEIENVFNKRPSWIVRNGIIFFAIAIVLIFALTWFIKYPDKVKGQMSITTTSPPLGIVSKSTGRIELLIKDNSWVSKGQNLAVIESTSNPKDMFDVIEKIDRCSITIFSDFTINQLPEFSDSVQLGDVQHSYINFLKSISSLKIYNELGYYRKLYQNIEHQIEYYNGLNDHKLEQKKLLKAESEISRENYARDSALHAGNVISDVDHNVAKMNRLESMSKYERLEEEIIGNNLQLATLNGRLNELKIEERKEVHAYMSDIRDNYKQVTQEVKNWQIAYVLTAPGAGQVSLLKFLTDQKFVKAGDEIMVIVPSEQNIYGQMIIPIAGSGLVRVGQLVNMRFDSYPAKDYGIVQGVVANVSLVPRENVYYLLIHLPDGLRTSYGNDISFKPEMLANGEIVTKKTRLLERIFNQFKQILDNMDAG